eukprot:15415914-Alexandrium_andersonii.AAC.1
MEACAGVVAKHAALIAPRGPGAPPAGWLGRRGVQAQAPYPHHCVARNDRDGGLKHSAFRPRRRPLGSSAEGEEASPHC